MTAIDLTEAVVLGGQTWHEPEAAPMLADYECRGCGFIPGIEVVACSCGFAAASAGGLVSGVTTVTQVSGHVVVRRG